GARPAAGAGVLRAVLAALIGLVLLVPDTVNLTGLGGAGSALRASYLDWTQLRVAIGAGEAIRLQAGTLGGGALGAVPVLVALFGLAMGRRHRLRWSIRFWPVALGGMAVMFLAGRDDLPAAPRLFPGAVAVSAVAIAVLCGLAGGAARRDLPDYPLGWRHAIACVLGVGLLAAVLPGLGLAVK